jgi:outer membrane biosynthesis protein TonB
MRRAGILIAGLAGGAWAFAAAAAAAEDLVAPAYPADTRDKPLSVNVVARGEPAAGKVAAVEVLYSDGPEPFAAAARAALQQSTFDAGRERVTVWYIFRLLQDTKVHDVSRGREPEPEVEPVLTEYVAPTFPPGAPSLRMKVALELFLGPDGKVWYAEPAEDGVTPLYEATALAAARQFVFEPATRGGEAVATWYPFVFEFE